MNAQLKTKIHLKLAHSPDADDAFMFYGLAKGFVQSDSIEFSHTLSDIETLNQKAMEGVYEMTAISVHAYPYVSDRYDILQHGASIGDRYGPILVAKEPMTVNEIRKKTIAVPGTMTTAYLALRLFEKDCNIVIRPFNQIISTVEKGEADLGLLIHEGQLTFSENGLHKILDLGEWWYQKTKLPLPLGVNGIRNDLDSTLQKEIARLMKESILYSLQHRKEAVEYALQFARGMQPQLADRFIGMYVNEETVQMSERTKKAIEILLDEGFKEELIPQKVQLRYV
jgi:1,4-dihydroxy-6-naphthoate synthase